MSLTLPKMVLHLKTCIHITIKWAYCVTFVPYDCDAAKEYEALLIHKLIKNLYLEMVRNDTSIRVGLCFNLLTLPFTDDCTSVVDIKPNKPEALSQKPKCAFALQTALHYWYLLSATQLGLNLEDNGLLSYGNSVTPIISLNRRLHRALCCFLWGNLSNIIAKL